MYMLMYYTFCSCHSSICIVLLFCLFYLHIVPIVNSILYCPTEFNIYIFVHSKKKKKIKLSICRFVSSIEKKNIFNSLSCFGRIEVSCVKCKNILYLHYEHCWLYYKYCVMYKWNISSCECRMIMLNLKYFYIRIKIKDLFYFIFYE